MEKQNPTPTVPPKLNRAQRRAQARAAKKQGSKPKDPVVYYECDPIKHADCPKTNCFLGGGPCHQTKHLEFARQPVKTCHMILPVEGEERLDLIRQYKDELYESATGKKVKHDAGR